MDTKNTALFFAGMRKILRTYTEFQLEALEGYDLSPNEIVVLSSISSFSLASDIASASGVSKALVSRSVKSLKEKGFISSAISSEDKREQNLALTSAGEKIAGMIAQTNHRFYDLAFKEFSDDEKEVLMALLRFMLKNLSEDDKNEFFDR